MFVSKVLTPKALFLVAVVVFAKAAVPKAQLSAPVVKSVKAPYQKAFTLLAVVDASAAVAPTTVF